MPRHNPPERRRSASPETRARSASPRVPAPAGAPAAAPAASAAFDFSAVAISHPEPRSASQPVDPERLRQARLRAPPRPAQPQITFSDPDGRQRAAFNVPMDSRHAAPVRYRTHDGVYEAQYRRNAEEQRVASMPFNVMAPRSRELFHGSHSGQHGTAGDASRVNMTPVSATGNVATIGRGFEQPQRALRPDQSGQVLDRSTPFAHQVVLTEYDQSVMRPRLASSASLDALRAGTPGQQAMAGAIETQASVVPVRQSRDMYTPGAGHARQLLGPDDVMGPRGGSEAAPRYPGAHLLAPRTQAAFERAGAPTGHPMQYTTREDPNQQRTNALLHADLMRQLPGDHPARQQYGQELTAAARGERLFPWQVLEQVRRTATQSLPSFSTGRNAEREAEQLRAEAQAYIGRSSGPRRTRDDDDGAASRSSRSRARDDRDDRDDRDLSPRRLAGNRDRSRSRSRSPRPGRGPRPEPGSDRRRG